MSKSGDNTQLSEGKEAREGLDPLRLDFAGAQFAKAASADHTRRAYGVAARDFEAFCTKLRLDGDCWKAADHDTIKRYLTWMALSDQHGGRGLKATTIAARLSGVTASFDAAGRRDMSNPARHPAVKQMMRGIRNTLGVRSTPKEALGPPEVRKIIRLLPATERGIRDRAVLLLGSATGMRRSELVNLDLDDLSWSRGSGRRHVDLLVRKSKRDQAGRGRIVRVWAGTRQHCCPCVAVADWLEVRGDAPGALFVAFRGDYRQKGRMSPEAMADIVKAGAAALGKDPDRYGAHSLRSGLATFILQRGGDIKEASELLGHRSPQTTLRYWHLDPGDAGKDVGL